MVLDQLPLVRLLIVGVLAVTVGYVWYQVGRGRWWPFLTDRFVYGVPWGSLLTILGVLAFYLFAQGGYTHWNEPVTIPFRSWAYQYPLGIVTSSVAHASPAHLTGNLVGTVVLAPMAEFAWGHYRPESHSLSTTDRQSRIRDRPLVRALLIFPAVVLLVSLVTSVYAFGWSLGFSGTVFAFLGFVLVCYPLATVIAMVGISGVSVFVRTLQEPVLREAAESGAPGPPGWASVNVQAHALGFLLGVVLGLALLWYRDEWPTLERIALGTLLVVLARGLWGFATSNDGVYYQHRGVGLVFVLFITFLFAVVVNSDTQPISDRFATITRGLVYGWLVLAVGGAVALVALIGGTSMVLAAVAVVPILAFPAVPILVPGAVGQSITRRHVAVALVCLLTAGIAFPSVFGNTVGMGDEPVPGETAVSVGDYHVTYAENATHGRIETNDSGLIVVSERRYVWTVAVTDSVLAHDDNATVQLGGVGWRDTVRAERTAWDVTGNDSAAVVDLVHEDSKTRVFTSDPVVADLQIANNTISVVPTDDRFRINVSHNGTLVGSRPRPKINETAEIGQLRVTTQQDEDTLELIVRHAGTRVLVAHSETADS